MRKPRFRRRRRADLALLLQAGQEYEQDPAADGVPSLDRLWTAAAAEGLVAPGRPPVGPVPAGSARTAGRRSGRRLLPGRRRSGAPGGSAQTRLAADLAWVVVGRLAPGELPVFDRACQAYYANPRRALAGAGAPLGFGGRLLTPVVLAVATEVAGYLLELAGQLGGPGGEPAADAVRRLFGVGAGDPGGLRLTLTAEQWAQAELVAADAARRRRLPAETARSVRAALQDAAAGP